MRFSWKGKTYYSQLLFQHNNANFLKAAVNSVLAQTYKNFEILIDNNSKDETSKIISSFDDTEFLNTKLLIMGLSQIKIWVLL